MSEAKCPAASVATRLASGCSKAGRLMSVTVAATLLLSAGSTAFAEHAVIDLRLISPDDEVSAGSDQEPPPGGVNKPPVAEAPAQQPLVAQFILTNVYPHGRIKNVTVRYYVARTEKLGRKRAPDEAELKKAIVTEGKVTMNFKPKCRVGARFRFRVLEPGLYTVRVETLNTDSDHEHFSAIDLKAGPAQSEVAP